MASRGIGQYIRQHFLDTTFRGLYHANAFDMALLVPYFIVLILLASYGLHRYVLVYLYYKHRKNRTIEPAGHFSDLPRITVQLPMYNEDIVAERVIDELRGFAFEIVARMGERRGVHYLRKFYPWYLAGEPVDHDEIAELLVMEEFDRVLERLAALAERAPLATTSGLN